MSNRNFREMLEAQWSRGNFVCVGLDSDYAKIPESIKVRRRNDYVETAVDFNNQTVEATRDFVCAYKPNIAFYECYGAAGMDALRHTVRNIHLLAPEVPVILDAKRADIGSTNYGYTEMAFDYLDADAITVNPYFGAESLLPFLGRVNKGVIVLCKTSNSGAGELQDLEVVTSVTTGDRQSYTSPLYQVVARRVANDWNKNGNCALVVGATYPKQLREVREVAGDIPFLIPGIGAQGGDLEKTVLAGMDSRGWGMIINSSRGIIFASDGEDFAEAARRETENLRNRINEIRERKVSA